MIVIGDETYLLAIEAARHLKVCKVTFYKRYIQLLQPQKVGERRHRHYKLSEVDRLNRVEPIEKAS